MCFAVIFLKILVIEVGWVTGLLRVSSLLFRSFCSFQLLFNTCILILCAPATPDPGRLGILKET